MSSENRSDEVYSKQHYVNCGKAVGFLRVLHPVSSTNKTDRHDITEILLKVAFNSIPVTIIICFHLLINYRIKKKVERLENPYICINTTEV